MASTFTLSGDVADLGLADYLVGPGNSRKIKGSVRSNLGAGDALIDTTTGLTLLGDTPVTIASDGTWSVTLIDTDATDLNVEAGTLQYELVVEYTSTGSPAKRVYRSGWFALTADTEFSDPTFVNTQLDLPSTTPGWRSEFTAEMAAIREQTIQIAAGDLTSTFVRFLDLDGQPLPAGSLVTITVDTVAGSIADITFEEN